MTKGKITSWEYDPDGFVKLYNEKGEEVEEVSIDALVELWLEQKE